MIVNADFSLKAVMNTQDMNWEPSPIPGVERKYLDRVGEEVAIASTVVKYAANSSFTSHVHGGGEEILVLDGVFSDEFGDEIINQINYCQFHLIQSNLSAVKVVKQKLGCAHHNFYLKTLDTIGKCQRPVFSVGVSQHMHKLTNL